jgi:hypothetical protein
LLELFTRAVGFVPNLAGAIASSPVLAFLEAGFEKEHLLEVVAVVAASTITNYAGPRTFEAVTVVVGRVFRSPNSKPPDFFTCEVIVRLQTCLTLG